MTTSHKRSTKSESAISFEVDSLERRLSFLYEARRGLFISSLSSASSIPGPAVWCHGCGKNAIFLSDGLNLCEDCQLTVEVEAENCREKK